MFSALESMRCVWRDLNQLCQSSMRHLSKTKTKMHVMLYRLTGCFDKVFAETYGGSICDEMMIKHGDWQNGFVSNCLQHYIYDVLQIQGKNEWLK